MLCLQGDLLKLILAKLNYSDIYDLFIFNKLTTAKNFYIMIKRIYLDSNLDHNEQSKVIEMCEKSLASVLQNRKESLHLDSITYYLFLSIYNL
jgi:hypothetical protein